MRIIAGSAKGFVLRVPKQLHVRPTLDRVREALFSILSPRLDGANFLDLFAGTGANGMEALSRGATMAAFVDHNQRALDFIEGNLERAGLSSRAVYIRYDLSRSLTQLFGNDVRFDVIFADPPYDFEHYDLLLRHLDEAELLAPGGVAVIEHHKQFSLPKMVQKLGLHREADYGDTRLSFYS